MLICVCKHCREAIHLTERPKVCPCGSVGGTLVGTTVPFTFGPCTVVKLPESLITLPKSRVVEALIISNTKTDKEVYAKHSLERQY